MKRERIQEALEKILGRFPAWVRGYGARFWHVNVGRWSRTLHVMVESNSGPFSPPGWVWWSVHHSGPKCSVEIAGREALPLEKAQARAERALLEYLTGGIQPPRLGREKRKSA